jgi:hypothetical protein
MSGILVKLPKAQAEPSHVAIFIGITVPGDHRGRRGERISYRCCPEGQNEFVGEHRTWNLHLDCIFLFVGTISAGTLQSMLVICYTNSEKAALKELRTLKVVGMAAIPALFRDGRP